MPDRDRVRYARRFTARTAGQPDIHGIQFPSGHVIYDQPDIGLEAATCIHHQDGSHPEEDESCTQPEGPEWEDYRFPVLHCPLWEAKEA